MWDKSKEKLLRQLWSKGLSASKISEQIPGTTRNSIIGKSHRLGLEARSNSRKSQFKTEKNLNIPPLNKNQKLGRKAKFKALLLSKDIEKENPIQIEDCNDSQCRYPNNHPGNKDFYFCGRTALEGTVYCSIHFLLCFQSKNEKEEEKITAEDIPSFLEKKIKSA